MNQISISPQFNIQRTYHMLTVYTLRALTFSMIIHVTQSGISPKIAKIAYGLLYMDSSTVFSPAYLKDRGPLQY